MYIIAALVCFFIVPKPGMTKPLEGSEEAAAQAE